MTVGNMESAELFDGGIKGRALRATKEISPGEVVFAEPSFAAVVFDRCSSQVCHSCFRRQASLHRCAQCRFAHYCDRTCQTACWAEHQQECHALRKLGEVPGDRVRLAARVMWRIHKEGGVAWDGQLLSVEELQDHVDDLPEEELQHVHADVHTLQRYWSCGRSQPSREDITHVLGMISANGFTLSEQTGLQAVGVGLFPNLGLVNHDCWPNCSVVLNHGSQSATNPALHSQSRIELRALRTVSEGEELTVSYVDVLDTSAERQRKLKQRFHFDCTCQRCSLHTNDHLMTAAADAADAAKVQEVTAFSEECLEKVDRCLMERDYQEVLALCSTCLDRQRDLLAETHLSHLRVLRAAVEALSHLRRFPEAAASARRLLQGYTKLHQPNHAQLGVAVMRAGVAHLHAGMTEAAHELICQAYRILLVSHGPNHSTTRDLEAMRRQAELQLKVLKQEEASGRPQASASAVGARQ